MKKIGIITFHNALNYGAILQSYALSAFIENEGYDVEIINYENDCFKYMFTLNPLKAKGLKSRLYLVYKWLFYPKTMLNTLRKNKKMSAFILNKMNLSDKCNRMDIAEFSKRYQLIISGSDQVWNFKYTENDYNYLLEFSNENHRIISYASSIGDLANINNDIKRHFKNNLEKFYRIGVREKSAKQYLKTFIDNNVEVVLDPTMLLDKEDWVEFSSSSTEIKCLKKDFILIYIIAPETNLIKVAKKLAEDEGLDIVVLGNSGRLRELSNYKNIIDASIEDFVYYIANAKYVFTTSYHGLIFSINLNVNFYYELSKEVINNNERLIDICDALKITNREITDVFLPKGEINWNDINFNLDSLKEFSRKFLLDCMK